MRVLLVACVFLVVAVNFSIACECGLEGSAGRIFKGSKARAHKYPWLAHIRAFVDRDEGTFAQCGGSLIDHQHILTAAHCVVDDDEQKMDASSFDVFLGKVAASIDDSAPHSVSDIWIDPEFNRMDLSNDFAILTLSEPVEFTQTVAPVCLPTIESGLDKLTVAGWGVTSQYDDTSEDLLEVDVSYLTREKCFDIKAKYFFKFSGTDMMYFDQLKGSIPGIVETHMCAVNQKTGGTACEGDSGGPLMHKSNDGLYYLMGVVSGSWDKCAAAEDQAGLYTRVNYYQDTIKSIAPDACWKSY